MPELEFRATKDLDLVLCVDVLEAGFVERFWAFVAEGQYQLKERSDGTPIKCRFTKPAQPQFPEMLELFAAAPFEVPAGQDIVPLAVDDEHSSLSAILLNNAYRDVVMDCRKVIEGTMCLTPYGLILLKARAWLDLTARRDAGNNVDSKHIRKHRNDVFRIALLLGAGDNPEVSPRVLEDLDRFLAAMEQRPSEWPGIEDACKKLPLSDPGELLRVLRSQFGLPGSD